MPQQNPAMFTNQMGMNMGNPMMAGPPQQMQNMGMQMPPQQQQQPQQQPKAPPKPAKDDPISNLNAIMANMNVNPQPQNQQAAAYQSNLPGMGGMGGMGGMNAGGQFNTGMPGGMGMNPMAGQFATVNMGGGMNPFMTNMMAQQQSAAGYVNPQHNQNIYQPGFNDPANPFGGMKGPSNESWAKDVNELGFDVKLEVEKE